MLLHGMSVIEALSLSTIRIECDGPDGPSVGTGFFCNFAEEDGASIAAVVTNKHVIKNSTTGHLRVHVLNSNNLPTVSEGVLITTTGNDFASVWLEHPSPDIDLCATPAFPLAQEARAQGQRMFISSLSLDRLPSPAQINDFIGMEKVVMIGYPNGLWDDAHNLPVFRSGTLASHYKYDWRGRPEFLIDCATFPGSSGSPVLGIDIGGYYTKSGYKEDVRAHLLGIVQGVFESQVDGEILAVPAPTSTRQVVARSLVPNNLGIAIKAHQLQVFDHLFRDKQFRSWRGPFN